MEKILNGTIDKNLIVGSEISWPKEFPELKLIDDLLRCGICYDYIKTCMVTPCAHSYCSICIRRSLLYKTACPTCFEETYETNLRNNRILDRVAELFLSIKDRLVKHLRIAAVHFNCNEKLQSPATSLSASSQKTVHQEETPKRNIQKPGKSSTKGKLTFKSPSLDSSSKKSEISKRLEDLLGTSTAQGPERKESNSLELSNEDEFQRITTVPPMFLQPKVDSQPKNVDVSTVPCPVCAVNIPERNINTHLDNCLANVDKPPVKSPVKARQKRNPLPKMVWSLMPEKDLRKKLKDYGLNSQGEKKALISRIQRYILLFNSECDKDNPRPVSEIVRQVEREEKQAPNSIQQANRLVVNKKTDPKIIEEENKKYIQDNKDSFKKLIEAMKEREGKNIKPTARASNVILSDDEDDDIYRDQSKVSNFPSARSYDAPSTSSAVWEHVDLSDSNSNGSQSPILGGRVSDKKSLCNGNTPASVQNYNSPNNTRGRTAELNKVTNGDLERNSPRPVSDSPFADENSFSSPPKRSPSCIITTHSDSEDSISLLVDKNIDEDFLESTLGPATENVLNGNSQLEDPDFVVDTEDQNENYSDEVFVPKRKSKRKLKSPVLGDSNQTPSPRRTRRRISK
uniref:RING-type E3 ubiquitin transferase n=1 Tax=Homalodisca liturata TaxID=320908 RepID=A0A1B6I9E3_9HEMI